LKLSFDDPLSTLNFNFNLRRYSVMLSNLRELVSNSVPVDNGFTIAMSEIKSTELFDLHCLVLDVQNIHGGAVQVDPVRPTFKAPATKRLKL
jgi:hypothetical protein